MKNRFRPHLIILALYTLLAMGLTWPLTLYLPTHVPGEATWAFDESTFVWNMWWLKHSLLTLGQSLFHTDYTFFPLGIDLTTYTFNLFNAAFGLPLQLALSLPPASNLTLLFSYISSAYGMFLLSLYLLPRHTPRSMAPDLAAFIAGAGFAFSASRMMYVALGHYNFVTIQWFPFYTLFLLQTLRRGRLKDGLLAGIFAALCLYAELTYSVFLLFLSVFIFMAEAARQKWSIFRRWPGLAMLIATAAMLTAPFILAVLPNFLDPAYAEPGWGEGLKLSADLVGLFSLTPLHPLAGVDWLDELRAVIAGTGRFADANTLFLGYGVLALALLGFATHRKTTRVWFWSAVSFTILSLGPLLTINGKNRFTLDGLEVTFPLPFALLHYLPILSANRVPNRFAIPLTLALAVLVGFGAWWLLKNLAGRGRWLPPLFAALLLGLLLFDQFSAPLPLTDARIPEVYTQIGGEAGDFTLMQLPLGWRNSYGTLGAERTQLQYYQAAHLRPMLGGNTSRNPHFKFDYFARIPLFFALTETELYRPVDEAVLDRASQQAAELMTLYNIKYLVVHEPLPHRVPYLDTYPATRALALDLIPHQPEPVYQSPGVEAFAVLPAPIPNPLRVDFGDWRSDPYRGAGWAGNETVFAATANWATAPAAEVFFPTHGPGQRRLSLQVAPFSYPDAPTQHLSLLLNGQPLPDTFSLHEGWQTIETTLPEAALVDGLNRLTLQFAHTAAPRQVLPAPRAIGSTGRDAPTDIEVNSGTDFAFITVGFGDSAVDASAHRRGVNVAVIEPETGAVVDFKGFDTAANDYEAAALAQFIDQIPAGQIVVIATHGPDAAAHLTPEASAALESIGLSPAMPTPPFSAIGVKGAQPGAALQSTGEGAAYLRLGPSPDTRPLAAAVDFIAISTP